MNEAIALDAVDDDLVARRQRGAQAPIRTGLDQNAPGRAFDDDLVAEDFADLAF